MNTLQDRADIVGVDSSNWSEYKVGVFSVCGGLINHRVILVEVDSYSNLNIRDS